MRRDDLLHGVGGALAALLAISIGEAAAGLVLRASPISALGGIVIRQTPAALVEVAIRLFGTYDKTVLVASLVLAAIVGGALVGVLSRRMPAVGGIVFLVWWAVGVLIVSADLGSGTALVAVTLLPGASAGWLVLRMMRPREGAAAESQGRAEIGVTRRRFIRIATSAAAASVAALLLSRSRLGAALDIEAIRRAIRLPSRPRETTVPAAPLDIPGLSPLIVPNDQFYRIDTALKPPRIDPESWRLRVTGMVDRPGEYTLQELLDLSDQHRYVTLSCVSNEVGGDLVGNAGWQGIPLATLLERAGVQSGATQIIGRSVDGFTVGFPTATALDGRDSMVALGMNDEPLPVSHGFPARLVIPGLYGYVSATKWLEEIELTTFEEFDAYWIRRGWAKEGPIKTQSRIDVPRGGTTVSPGNVMVAGVAWAGIRGIRSVEVAINPAGSPSAGAWQAARLGEVLSGSSWRQWAVDWDAGPGEYEIAVRATDDNGEVQDAHVRPPHPDGATGYHLVRVRVTA